MIVAVDTAERFAVMRQALRFIGRQIGRIHREDEEPVRIVE
ncbi:hypothetical protein [Burkholderia sp. 8Y]|nr:hypothetical protein [Burkholderia sp. 8Y]